jgi:hypothetical protein
MKPKAKAIMFSAPMVCAILAGTKTQTRRICKKQDWNEAIVKRWPEQLMGPYLKGDILWVRENWRLASAIDDHDPYTVGKIATRANLPLQYEADKARSGVWELSYPGRLRRSLHMPRWASRLTLEATQVRVQRLQDISEADAKAEGVTRDEVPCDHARRSCEEIGCLGPTHKASFCDLWCDLHGPGSWKENPWVVAITFVPHHVNIERFLEERKAA